MDVLSVSRLKWNVLKDKRMTKTEIIKKWSSSQFENMFSPVLWNYITQTLRTVEFDLNDKQNVIFSIDTRIGNKKVCKIILIRQSHSKNIRQMKYEI